MDINNQRKGPTRQSEDSDRIRPILKEISFPKKEVVYADKYSFFFY